MRHKAREMARRLHAIGSKCFAIRLQARIQLRSCFEFVRLFVLSTANCYSRDQVLELRGAARNLLAGWGP